MSEIRLSVDSDALARAFPSAFVGKAAHRIEKLAGDASTREYYRIHRQGDLPLILQVTDPFAESDLLRHPFLSARKLLEDWEVAVPRFVGARAESGWILLEDLGDGTLQNELSLENYRKAVDLLVEWTIRGVSSHARTIHFEWAFDFTKLQAEMAFTAEHLVEGVLGLDPKPYLAAVASNSQYLSNRPRFFCHRDYHSRNLMYFAGQLYVIDFQDARLGPISYDIVSLLWDPYVRLSESWRADLLQHWIKRLEDRSEEIGAQRQIFDALELESSPAAWEIELERMKIQRLLKAAGSYASFYRKKGRLDYLPSVFPALEDTIVSLRRLETWSVATPDDRALLTQLESWDLLPVRRLLEGKV